MRLYFILFCLVLSFALHAGITSGAHWESRGRVGVTSAVPVYFNHSWWLWGGFNDLNTWTNRVWRSSDGIAWFPVADISLFTARRSPRFVEFKGSLYLHGGLDSLSRTLSDLWVTTDGQHWRVPTNVPRNTGVLSIEKVGDTLYMDPNIRKLCWTRDGVHWTSGTWTLLYNYDRLFGFKNLLYGHRMGGGGFFSIEESGTQTAVGNAVLTSVSLATNNRIYWIDKPGQRLLAADELNTFTLLASGPQFRVANRLLELTTSPLGIRLFRYDYKPSAYPPDQPRYEAWHSQDGSQWFQGDRWKGLLRKSPSYDYHNDRHYTQWRGQTWFVESNGIYAGDAFAGFTLQSTPMIPFAPALYLKGDQLGLTGSTQSWAATDSGNNWTTYSTNLPLLSNNRFKMWNGKHWCIGGNQRNPTAVLVSDDGQAWTTHSTSLPASRAYGQIAEFQGRLWILNSFGLTSSNDLVHFTTHTLPANLTASFSVGFVARQGRLILCATNASTNNEVTPSQAAVWTSSDGDSWQLITDQPEFLGFTLTGITSGGPFVHLYTSDHGRSFISEWPPENSAGCWSAYE